MAKTKISEYSSTANSNTDIASINIDEGCAPSGINNAIRALMAQIHDLYAGTSGDTWPVTAGGTGSGTASGARTNLGLVIGTDVQAYDADLAAIALSGKGAEIASYGTYGVGFKNRIINGAMMIDQRNAGLPVTPTNGAYTIDRWRALQSTDGAATVQQVSDAPAGFSFSFKWTTTTADSSLAAGQYAGCDQKIEGFNTADLAFGTASAATITISFWVKSSLTGTFGGAIANSAFNRSYPFTYTINSANTWEQKSVTIVGDTTGTWVGATNGNGMFVQFGLGVGSTYSGTAGSWSANGYITATGAVSVIGTLNATWQITGVQLEKGSTATSFDYRPYGTELALCQRYYVKYQAGAAFDFFAQGAGYATTYARVGVPTRVTMRAVPSLGSSAASTLYLEGTTSSAISSITGYGTTTPNYLVWQANTSSTVSGALWLYANNTTSAYLDASAEL